jgi:DNA polymerase alpha subunit B
MLVQLGPFIDLANSRIKTGEIDHSPAQLFREEFSTRLRDFFDVSPNSLVLVVPSIRDVISNHATLPQCELGPEFYSDPVSICVKSVRSVYSLLSPSTTLQRVHLLPNPCRFSINDVSFAVSTVDVLFHLRKEEYLKKGEVVDPSQTSPEDLGNDVMTNLCRHVLQQRRYGHGVIVELLG